MVLPIQQRRMNSVSCTIFEHLAHVQDVQMILFFMHQGIQPCSTKFLITLMNNMKAMKVAPAHVLRSSSNEVTSSSMYEPVLLLEILRITEAKFFSTELLRKYIICLRSSNLQDKFIDVLHDMYLCSLDKLVQNATLLLAATCNRHQQLKFNQMVQHMLEIVVDHISCLHAIHDPLFQLIDKLIYACDIFTHQCMLQVYRMLYARFQANTQTTTNISIIEYLNHLFDHQRNRVLHYIQQVPKVQTYVCNDVCQSILKGYISVDMVNVSVEKTDKNTYEKGMEKHIHDDFVIEDVEPL